MANNPFNKFLSIICCSLLLISCSKKPSAGSKTHTDDKKEMTGEAKVSNGLALYDLDNKEPREIKVPALLREISGLTMTPDGRLFAMQDEQGYIFQIDLNNGNIIRKFSIGNPLLRKDFEDIAYANGKFYMIESNGRIYEFNEGGDGETVEYKVFDTGLKGKSDVEGLCYDDSTGTLLLACKGNPEGVSRDEKAVYSFSLNTMKLDPNPLFLLKRSDLRNNFNPSGIEKNPVTGTFFVIASDGNLIVEIDEKGNYLGQHDLSKKIHKQPEGITFADDGTMYISNEGRGGDGTIVIYPMKE